MDVAFRKTCVAVCCMFKKQHFGAMFDSCKSMVLRMVISRLLQKAVIGGALQGD